MTELIRHYYLIIPHVSEPCVVLMEGNDGWTLPKIPGTAYLKPKDINLAAWDAWGADVNFLRVVHCHDEYPDVTLIDAVENWSARWKPPANARWVSYDDLKTLALASPIQAYALDIWFGEQRSGKIPGLRAPWSRPGWFEVAVGWIGMQIDRFKLGINAPVEQHKKWSLTCMMSVNTPGGDLYFKAVPPMFAREPLLTRYLAEQHPQNIPELIEVDVEWAWLLMRDFQATTLNGSRSAIETWEKALRRYAEIQVEQIGKVDRLAALGCPDRRLNVLMRQMDTMLADTAAMLSGERRGLSEAEIGQVRALAPKLKAMGAELATSGIPYTLVHGDFHANNVAVKHPHRPAPSPFPQGLPSVAGRGGERQGELSGEADSERIIFYDWTDGCIAFPFFDLVVFLEDSDLPEDVPDLRAAYSHLSRTLDPVRADAAPARYLGAGLSAGGTAPGVQLLRHPYEHGGGGAVGTGRGAAVLAETGA